MIQRVKEYVKESETERLNMGERCRDYLDKEVTVWSRSENVREDRDTLE